MLKLQRRDGQKRPVFIYRLLSAGTIDGSWRMRRFSSLNTYITTEKIFQRQVTKLGLSDCEHGSLLVICLVLTIRAALMRQAC